MSKIAVTLTHEFTEEQWNSIVKDYDIPEGDYHIFTKNRRKKYRCDECGAYYGIDDFQGFCTEEEYVVDANGTCEAYH